MKHGIVSLEKLLPGWYPPVTEPPTKIIAPNPTAPKVIGDPTREPVNKQAAMLITRAHYLELPPLPPSDPPKGMLEKLQQENTTLRLKNENLLAENIALKRKLERAQQKPKVKIKTIHVVENEKPTLSKAKRELLERMELL